MAVEHAGGGWTTRIIEQIQKQTETLSTDVRDLQKQLALEQLDRQWAEEVQKSHKGGNIASPWYFVLMGSLFTMFMVWLSFRFPRQPAKHLPTTIFVAGMMSMMKFRTEPFDAADLAGTYQLGLWTLFLLPEASGADAAIGRLEIGETGSFRIVATNNLGQEFTYTGTTRAESDGTLTFTVTDPYTETWYGAFDDAYGTVVLCDTFKEVRANRQVELSLGIAVRPRVPANQ